MQDLSLDDPHFSSSPSLFTRLFVSRGIDIFKVSLNWALLVWETTI